MYVCIYVCIYIYESMYVCTYLPEQRLGRHDDERFTIVSQQLPPQEMEIVGWYVGR